jgi:predicted RNA-binding protein YlxR (DUF448 family)
MIEKKNTQIDAGKQTARLKHLPERTCIACKNTRAKKELIRLVLTNDNLVEIDLSGKKNGRGAYLCPEYPCWEQGLKKNRLDYALKTKIAPSNRQSLIAFAESLPGRS